MTDSYDKTFQHSPTKPRLKEIPKSSLKLNNLIKWSSLIHLVTIAMSVFYDGKGKATDGHLIQFTDIDYWVLWDGAEDWLFKGTPYNQAVYRYSPLLAAILLPFVYIKAIFKTSFISFLALLGGKLVFSVCNLIVAFFAWPMINSNCEWRTKLTVYLWLFNPLVIVIATRGNADAVVCAVNMAYAYALKRRRLLTSAILLGLATHLKIFPVFYGLPVAFHLLRSGRLGKAALFFVTSSLTFAILTLAVYGLFGSEGIYAYLIYHLQRQDVRHNFSPFFYPFYLFSAFSEHSKSLMSILMRWASFLPQLAAMTGLALRFSGGEEDFPTAFFLQTIVFVHFNKVFTSQVQNFFKTETPKKCLLLCI